MSGGKPTLLNKRQQLDEIVKAGRDPVYFMNTYVSIQHPIRGLIRFETYPFQDECVKAFEEHRLNIVLKSRQLGLSTVAAAYAVWLAIFRQDKNVLVIATKLQTAMTFIRKVKVIIQNLPDWIVIPKYDMTKTSMTCSNGSSITAVPTSPDAGRSEALSLLICDEAAFIEDFENIWAGLQPTLSTGGNAIILSTPNGVGGQYYKLWVEANLQRNDGPGTLNGFNPIKLPWNVHPEHDEKWFKNETRNLPKRKVSQEYICSFETSGDTFIGIDDLEKLRFAIRPPLEKRGHQGNVWIWNKPEPGNKYVLSADVSRGDSNDFSAFHVIDYETCEIVAEYLGKMAPDKFAALINDVGREYNDACVAPESNTYGWFVIKYLMDTHQYPNIFYDNGDDPFSGYVNPDEKKLGFNTTSRSRDQILTKLEEMIRNDVLQSKSERLHAQLMTFIMAGSKAKAMRDSHDDLVMSIAIGSWICRKAKRKNKVALAYAMLAATTAQSTDVSVLNIPRAGKSVYINPALRSITPQNVHKPREISDFTNKNVDLSDMSWLLK